MRKGSDGWCSTEAQCVWVTIAEIPILYGIALGIGQFGKNDPLASLWRTSSLVAVHSLFVACLVTIEYLGQKPLSGDQKRLLSNNDGSLPFSDIEEANEITAGEQTKLSRGDAFRVWAYRALITPLLIVDGGAFLTATTVTTLINLDSGQGTNSSGHNSTAAPSPAVDGEGECAMFSLLIGIPLGIWLLKLALFRYSGWDKYGSLDKQSPSGFTLAKEIGVAATINTLVVLSQCANLMPLFLAVGVTLPALVVFNLCHLPRISNQLAASCPA